MWGRYWRYSANLSAGTCVRTGVLVSLVLLDVAAPIAVGIAGVSSMLLILLLGPKTPWRPSGPVPWSVRLGLSLALASLAVTILQMADRLALPILSSPHASGQYA